MRPLPRHRGRGGGRTARRRTACRCGRSRWRPRRRSAARRARGTRAPSAATGRRVGELHAGRALHERLDDHGGQLVGVRGDQRAARRRSSRGRRSRGRAAPGSAAGRTRRCRSRRRRPRARRSCRRGRRRRRRGSVVRPVTPWLAQYWNAIFSACSTAAAPSEAKRKWGSSTGTPRRERLGQLDDDPVAVAEHRGVGDAVELLADGVRRARARGGRAW